MDRYAHLVFCSLATWPPHFHFISWYRKLKMERKILGLSLKDRVPNTRIREITKLDDVAQHASRLFGNGEAMLRDCRTPDGHIYPQCGPPAWDRDIAADLEPGRCTLDPNRREPQRMATPRRRQQHQGERPSATRTSSEPVRSFMHQQRTQCHPWNNHAK